MAAHNDHAHSDDPMVMAPPHVCSAQTFGGILLALFFLTFVTVWVAQFDFGGANMWIAMGVASVKAALVMAVFMHLLWDTTINKIFFISSFLFLGLLFLFGFADLMARADLEPKHDRVAPLNPMEMGELQRTDSSEKKFFDQFKQQPPAPK